MEKVEVEGVREHQVKGHIKFAQGHENQKSRTNVRVTMHYGGGVGVQKQRL